MGRILLLPLLSSLVACGQSPADIVTSTSHCGGVLVRPDLLMRLSKYHPVRDSIAMWVVQACHPEGGCQPVLTYHHALPPAYSIAPSGEVQIDILGGFIEEVHREEISIGDARRPIIINHMKGTGDQAELDAFRARIGLPPGNRSWDNCDPALDARASVRARPTSRKPSDDSAVLQ